MGGEACWGGDSAPVPAQRLCCRREGARGSRQVPCPVPPLPGERRGRLAEERGQGFSSPVLLLQVAGLLCRELAVI